jgi:hypothetical protein
MNNFDANSTSGFLPLISIGILRDGNISMYFKSNDKLPWHLVNISFKNG